MDKQAPKGKRREGRAAARSAERGKEDKRWKWLKRRDDTREALVIVMATTFQLTERSFPLSRLCGKGSILAHRHTTYTRPG